MSASVKISGKTLYNTSPEIIAKHCTGGRFIFRPFQTYMSEIIVCEILKGNGRLVIEVPPQHGKSAVVSHWVPVWFLSNFPQKHILMFSAESDLADGFGRLVRNTVRENREILFCELSQDSKAVDRWHTTQGGSMISSSVDGTGVSNPGHLIIIDDPFRSWADAMSATKRKKVIDWYVHTITQRFQEDTTVIVVHTRWHKKDLAGHLLSDGVEKWREVRLPALAEKNDPLGRKEGEPLLPKIKGKKYLQTRREEAGAMGFAAVYQQSPQVEDGNIFKREWWQRYTHEAKPKFFDTIIDSWDTAFETKKVNAYSCCTTWGKIGVRFYLIAFWRGKVDYPTLRKKVIQIHEQNRSNSILVEGKATGKPIIQELKTAGLSVIEAQPVTDKLNRAHSVAAIFENGRVFVPEGESWADDVVAGCAEYPNGDWTDCVDTISQALTWLYITSSKGLLPGDLLVGKVEKTFRFSGGLSGYSLNTKPHWYRDCANIKIRSWYE